MIRQAQIKFIAIIMSVLLMVFSLIFAVSYFLLNLNKQKNIDYTLMHIEANYLSTNTIFAQNAFSVEIAKSANPQQSKEFRTTSNLTNLTDKQIDDVTTAIMNINSDENGNFGTFYYRIYETDKRYIVSVLNAEDVIYDFNATMTYILLTLIVLYLILFIPAMYLARKTFEPIKESFDNQKEFTSNASHELKTPLAIITANTEVLKHENGNNQWINNISEQTDRLALLVKDMLSLSKMDEKSLVLEKNNFDLSEQIETVALGFDALAFEKEKTFSINIQKNIFYYGNVESVKNLVNILLDNAIKHASPLGNINLALKKENLKIVLTIQNTGSNVREEDSNKIFERFYRGDASRSRDSGGSGLGLAIAKNIAIKNKWKISAQSIYEKSMTIKVIF